MKKNQLCMFKLKKWKFKNTIDGINSRPDKVKGQFC